MRVISFICGALFVFSSIFIMTGDVDVDVSLFQDELDGLDLEDSGDDDDGGVAAMIRASGE